MGTFEEPWPWKMGALSIKSSSKVGYTDQCSESNVLTDFGFVLCMSLRIMKDMTLQGCLWKSAIFTHCKEPKQSEVLGGASVMAEEVNGVFLLMLLFVGLFTEKASLYIA